MHSTVTDADLSALKDLKGLQVLILWGTQVTDAGLEHLKELKGLQRLGLGGTRVTDALNGTIARTWGRGVTLRFLQVGQRQISCRYFFRC